MRIRTWLMAISLATIGIIPLASPAQATHSCGFEPCAHPEDVTQYVCYRFPVLGKYGIC